MTDTTAADTARLVEHYLQAWNETDPERRRALLEDTFTSDASYLDPLMSGEGHTSERLAPDGRLRTVTGFLEHVAGATAPDRLPAGHRRRAAPPSP